MMQSRTNVLGASLSKVVVVALLSIPALMSFIGTSKASSENRTLTNAPSLPNSWQSALEYPAKLDAWINDHFGFRERFVRLNNRIRYSLFQQFPTIQVIQGRGERIFLSAHATTHEPYSAILLSCGYRYNNADHIAEQLNRFGTAFRSIGVVPKLMVVPSAPALYLDELPPWLQDRCTQDSLPVPRILASEKLHSSAKDLVYYPMQEMQSFQKRVDIIPSTWFHWNGAGLGLVAESSVRHLWDKRLQDKTPIATQKEYLRSDISHLFPGIKLGNTIDVIDFQASGINQCLGGACYPELQPIMEKLGDVSRYRNPRGHGRMILLSDSFGFQIAGWYAHYFNEVMHISTNNLGRLDKGELEQLRQSIFKDAGRDNVLFLYHDVSLLYGRLGADLDQLGL